MNNKISNLKKAGFNILNTELNCENCGAKGLVESNINTVCMECGDLILK